MPKRNSDASENERKLRKIRKMEKKIEKYKDSLNLTATDPEISSILEHNGVEDNIDMSEAEDKVQNEQKETEEHEHEEDHDQEDGQFEEEGEVEIEEELPQDILAALGQGGQDDDTDYGAELKPEIVKIFNNILTDGLNKEMHESLAKTKIPRNAKLLDAPKLNSEFTGLLNNSLTNRDNMLKDRQQDLGRAISLITQTTCELTKKDFDKLQAIKSLSDSIRLLSNLHHQYTVIRRKLIAPVMDKSLMQNLNENKRSEFLYSKLEESVKTSSAMKRTINILKPKNVPKNYQNPRRQTVSTQYAQRTNKKPYHPNNQTPAYKTNRSHPRAQHQARPARRPATSHYRGSRAKYP